MGVKLFHWNYCIVTQAVEPGIEPRSSETPCAFHCAHAEWCCKRSVSFMDHVVTMMATIQEAEI